MFASFALSDGPTAPVALVVATLVISEAWLSAPAARSEYNWFHIRQVEYGPCAATPRWRTGSDRGPAGGIHEPGKS